ncbi:hypothetical protein [Erythrobacter mangrovi]|uniref:Uncharacterized protein n=1 Tax=Erythrobacter mangrovi TaxID=2739433 RepID=A0A7D3XT58_9SPHN|nr:hypothetical protein [Erythrobacter mangrovi]QKG72191.1 hypothetical protein HQR01_12905 [Erythrobacter mangrovi]
MAELYRRTRTGVTRKVYPSCIIESSSWSLIPSINTAFNTYALETRHDFRQPVVTWDRCKVRWVEGIHPDIDRANPGITPALRVLWKALSIRCHGDVTNTQCDRYRLGDPPKSRRSVGSPLVSLTFHTSNEANPRTARRISVSERSDGLSQLLRYQSSKQ